MGEKKTANILILCQSDAFLSIWVLHILWYCITYDNKFSINIKCF